MILLNAGCSQTAPEPDASPLFARVVDGNVFDTTPVQGELEPLRYAVGPYSYDCNECHSDFAAASIETVPQGVHRDVVDGLKHGAEVRCLNCHHPDNRNAYLNNSGGEISPAEPNRLCERCHGPIHRDWTEGLHGRQNGFWDTGFGPRVKLECIQCHDPHDPAFPMMTPDPAPYRSRFEQSHEEPH